MKIIKKLAEMIEEELEDAEKYAKCSLKHRDDDPELSHVFHELATEEMRHADMLHGEVVKLIEKHKREHGDPPAAMLAVWEYVHERNIEKAHAVKILLEK